jgi:hypothetical protein
MYSILGNIDIGELNVRIYDYSTMLVDFMKDDGIGSSDISCTVRTIVRSFDLDYDQCDREELALIRQAVQREVSEYSHALEQLA